MKPQRIIEDKLISVIMKYRDGQEQFFDVEEREKDRQEVTQMYDQLETLPQKILDSRCYLEFGRVQQKQSEQFLADSTTPSQRLGMVSYILRTVRKPIVFLSGKSSLLGQMQPNITPIVQIQEQKGKKPKILEHICKARGISLEEIEKCKKEIHLWLQDWSKNFHKLSVLHKEILSQMAANKEIVIPTYTANEDWMGTVRSAIIGDEK